jgi:hypothetical protein
VIFTRRFEKKRLFIKIVIIIYCIGGTRWPCWLMHCSTSRQVAGSLETFIDIILPGPTQSLTEMSTRNISWGVEASGAEGWQAYHLKASEMKNIPHCSCKCSVFEFSLWDLNTFCGSINLWTGQCGHLISCVLHTCKQICRRHRELMERLCTE